MIEERVKYIPSFGRRGGKSIKPNKRESFETLLPELEISVDELNDISEQETWLEIGFGGGEHLAHRAKNNPEINYIGSEVYKYGVSKLVNQIDEENIKNIRLFTEDGRLMLDALQNSSIDGVYILFPDPWPKIRHHKRRIINNETLDILARILKKGAKLNIATDHYEYAEWIFVQMEQRDDFKWLAESKSGWETPPEGHIQTRYQEKNKAETAYPLFLNFSKM